MDKDWKKWNSGVSLLRVALLRLVPSRASLLKTSCLNGSICIEKTDKNEQVQISLLKLSGSTSFLLCWRACCAQALLLDKVFFCMCLNKNGKKWNSGVSLLRVARGSLLRGLLC